jgi:hypothetical protein
MFPPFLSGKDRSGDGSCRTLFAGLAENNVNVSGQAAKAKPAG